jgi:hypothetical protein
MWTPTANAYIEIGSIVGPTGPQGAVGNTGPAGTGVEEDLYLVDGNNSAIAAAYTAGEYIVSFEGYGKLRIVSYANGVPSLYPIVDVPYVTEFYRVRVTLPADIDGFISIDNFVGNVSIQNATTTALNTGGGTVTIPGEVWTAQASRNYVPNQSQVNLRVLEYFPGYGFIGANTGQFTGVYRSEDGVNWTYTALTGGSGAPTSIAYGAGVGFVITTYTTGFWFSADAVSWEFIPHPGTGSDYVYSIAYASGMFLAVAGNGAVFTSITGRYWTASAPLSSGSTKEKVVSDGTTFTIISSNKVERSTDGVTWSNITVTGIRSDASAKYLNGTYLSFGQSTSTYHTSVDGITWVSRTLPGSGSWYNLAYGSGVYSIISFDGSASYTSPDAITWTSRTAPSAIGASSIYTAYAYGNGNFIFGSLYTTIWGYSSNAQSWTQLDVSGQSVFYGLSIAGSRLYVSTSTNVAHYSDDAGITWNSITMPAAELKHFAYKSGVYVAVGYGNYAYTSSSGTGSWTQRAFATALPNGDTWSAQGIVHNGTRFYTYSYFGSYTFYYTSDDGITWTRREYPSMVTNSGPMSAIWDGSKFVAPIMYEACVYTSADAITWTRTNISNSYLSIAYGGGIYVMSASGGKIAVSSNGTSWTESTISWPDTNGITVSYANGKFILSSTETNAVAVSTNGASWSYGTLPVAGRFYHTLKPSAGDTMPSGRALLAGYAGTLIESSDQGATWSSLHVPSSYSGGLITYSNGRFIGTSGSASSYIYISRDGFNWSRQTMPSSQVWIPGAYNPTTKSYAVVAKNATTVAYSVATSPTWSTATLPSAQTWSELCYDAESGIYIVSAVGTTTAAKATNIASWSSIALPASPSVAITTANGKFYLINSGSSSLYYSVDGSTWTSATLPMSATWTQVFGGNSGKNYVLFSQDSIASLYSSDGAIWIEAPAKIRFAAIANPVWVKGIYSGNSYIIVGHASYNGDDTNIAAVSYDGVTWDLKILGLANGGYPLVVGSNGVNQFSTVTARPERSYTSASIGSVNIG